MIFLRAIESNKNDDCKKKIRISQDSHVFIKLYCDRKIQINGLQSWPDVKLPPERSKKEDQS